MKKVKAPPRGPVKVMDNVYRVPKGWLLRPKVQGKARKHTILDREHRLTPQALRAALDAFKVEVREKLIASGQAVARKDATGLRQEIEEYMRLPKVLKMPARNQRARRMHLLTLAGIVNQDGIDRSRLTIKKREWEQALGQLFQKRKWKANTFNNWVTSVQSFYTKMDDPDGRDPNPARKLEKMDLPKRVVRAIKYDLIVRVLERVRADMKGGNFKLLRADEAVIRKRMADGANRRVVAQDFGITEAAIRKLLKRPAREVAREIERLALWLWVIAFTGIRHVQAKALQPGHFEPDHTEPDQHGVEQPAPRVWITQSGKRDRSFWKPLDVWGVYALQAVADANAWGDFENKNLLRLWYAGCAACELPKKYPNVYALRHSYLTEAYRRTGSLDVLARISGHYTTKTLEVYTVGAEDPLARSAVDKLGAGWAASIGAPPQKPTAPAAVLAFKGKKRRRAS